MRIALLVFCPLIGFCQSRIEIKPVQLFAEVGGVRAFHTGLQGGFAQHCTFQMKVSYSENFGTYDRPFPNTVEQFSSLVQVGIPLNKTGWLLTLAAASDQGGLFPTSSSGFASVRKTWDYYKYRSRKI